MFGDSPPPPSLALKLNAQYLLCQNSLEGPALKSQSLGSHPCTLSITSPLKQNVKVPQMGSVNGGPQQRLTSMQAGMGKSLEKEH